MTVTRGLKMLCVVVAGVLLYVPFMGVDAELISTPLRQLMEEVVKVHVKVHQKEVAPATEYLHKHHKKEEEKKKGEGVNDSEIVPIETDGATSVKYEKALDEKNQATKQAQNDESVIKYNRGSVKISGGNDSGEVDKDTQNKRSNVKKTAATEKEQEVISATQEVNELATKLSSTPFADKKSFHDTYGPTVVICGIIGGLAAVIGVAGLIMDHPQSMKDTLDSDESAKLDVDIEAHIASVEDKDNDSDSDSGSDSSNDEDEEEGSFANSTAHVSV
ncbi:unnamed protein product [Peronospora belbahrii]|uniref:Uncharacterized protein n=1 Tax=Peronospora belbahrii TaxID=622444 RepID=A0AAU9KXJ0_9STRA|nr:unnamed protein product [Peronospora belbahrii]CAH0515563.1 unnamed protein product [Peronospora belbahrii]